jgi:hypothetical protein
VRERETSLEEYVGFLREILDKTPEQFLLGGQAVNFWADYYDRKSQLSPLGSFRPFTSKDCDIWVSFRAWSEIQKMQKNQLIKGTSPVDGQLGILTLQKDPPLVVDLLSGVYGIRHDELLRLCERAPVFDGIKVIDPLYLFRSKCHCLMGLPQTGRQDERHVRMMALVLPEYLTMLIDGVDEGSIPERAMLKEIKLLRKMTSSTVCRRCMEQLDLDGDDLVPWERLRSSRSELLGQYAEKHREERG